MRVGLALALIAATAAFHAGSASAEDFAALGGLTDTDDHSSASYSWALEYRQHFGSFFDLSLGYLNEGHLPGHHRDGGAAQAWGRVPLWNERLSLAVGAGPYVYFDTLTDDPGAPLGYRDYHGVGVIATAALSYSLSERWFALLELNEVMASADVGTRTVLLGMGYRLDHVIQALSSGAVPGAHWQDSAPLNEIGVFVGETVINGTHADASNAFGAEYRRQLMRHLELSASVLSDSDGLNGRHQAATAELWLVQEFAARRLVAGLGLGSYFSFQSYSTIDQVRAASVVGLASMTVAWRFTRSLDLRLLWHRGFTGDDQDRDIVTMGLGWRF
jgi:hypothetical protein